MSRVACALSLLAALSLIPCAGCGQAAGNAAPVSTVPVKGTVRYKGRPLARGTVKFEPESVGREAQGEIGPDGTFTLSTYAACDGAVLGNHRVAVTGAALPVKYSNFASSQIEVQVTADRTDYPIDLK
jgi:hypothetical protein